MNVWTNNKFTGFYPVGTAAVVVADTAEQAAGLLNAELERLGLMVLSEPHQFALLPTTQPMACVLYDGDY
jgi:hypothetical protein